MTPFVPPTPKSTSMLRCSRFWTFKITALRIVRERIPSTFYRFIHKFKAGRTRRWLSRKESLTGLFYLCRLRPSMQRNCTLLRFHVYLLWMLRCSRFWTFKITALRMVRERILWSTFLRFLPLYTQVQG